VPKIDLDSIPQTNSTGYPREFAGQVQERWARRLGPALGIKDFGANQVTLKKGAWSSQRHWHEDEDEIVIMLSGTAVLVDDNGRTPMRAGDVAVLLKGDRNAHHLINEQDEDCVFFAIGHAPLGGCHYPDVDLDIPDGKTGYRRKDGSRFES
jgi:uncharacterized cupin superfamily protein